MVKLGRIKIVIHLTIGFSIFLFASALTYIALTIAGLGVQEAGYVFLHIRIETQDSIIIASLRARLTLLNILLS
jgi:hypothetical protein